MIERHPAWGALALFFTALTTSVICIWLFAYGGSRWWLAAPFGMVALILFVLWVMEQRQ